MCVCFPALSSRWFNPFKISFASCVLSNLQRSMHFLFNHDFQLHIHNCILCHIHRPGKLHQTKARNMNTGQLLCFSKALRWGMIMKAILPNVTPTLAVQPMQTTMVPANPQIATKSIPPKRREGGVSKENSTSQSGRKVTQAPHERHCKLSSK